MKLVPLESQKSTAIRPYENYTQIQSFQNRRKVGAATSSAVELWALLALPPTTLDIARSKLEESLLFIVCGKAWERQYKS